MPMLFTRRELNHIARTDFFNRAAFALHPAAAENHNERLTKRMRVPCGARARLERDAGADRAGGRDGLK